MNSPISRNKLITAFPSEKPTRTQSLEKNKHSKTILSSLLVCPICKEKIKQSHMCPHCSKLFCQNCIKNWVVTKKPECPNCSHCLRLTMIVNCSQLGKELEEAINIMNKEVEENQDPIQQNLQYKIQKRNSSPEIHGSENLFLCKQHQIKLEYYCETCRTGICSDCAVLTEIHRYHKLCKLSQKRRNFQEDVQKIIKKIETHRQAMLKGKQEGLQKIQKLKQKQNNHLSLLQTAIKRLINETSKKGMAVIEKKEQFCNQLFQSNMEEAATYDRLLKNLKMSSKASLMRNYEPIYEEISQCIKNNKVQQRLHPTITSEIIPEYEQKKFILDNYTHMREKRDILYSQAFFWRGIEWRLKIYPGGLVEDRKQKDLDQYLAIYLEMSKGYKDHLNSYKYKIQLLNQVDENKKISRVFESEFEEGLCWGYDTFAKITTLYQEKYVHPQQDYLQILLCVKCPTYYHAVNDQNYMIETKTKQFQENIGRLRELRKQLGKNKVMISKNNKSSRTVQALIDESEIENYSIRKIKSNNQILSKQTF